MAAIVGTAVGLISFAFCYLLPAYSSFKALRSGNRKTVIKLLIHYTVISLLAGVELPADLLLGWLPFYTLGKLTFVLWLTLPQTQGTIFIYRNVIHPQLLANEHRIDGWLGQAEALVWHYAIMARDKSFTLGRELLTHYSQQGTRLIADSIRDPSQVLSVASTLYLQVQASIPAKPAAPAAAPTPAPTSPNAFSAAVKNDVSPATTPSTSLIHDLDESAADIVASRAGSSARIVELSSLDDEHDADFEDSSDVDDIDDDDDAVDGSDVPAAAARSPVRPAAVVVSRQYSPRVSTPLRSTPATPNFSTPLSAIENDAPFSDADVADEIRLSSPWRVLRALNLPVGKPSEAATASSSPSLTGNATAEVENLAPPPAPAKQAATASTAASSTGTKSRSSIGKSAAPAGQPASRRVSSSKFAPLRTRLSVGRPIKPTLVAAQVSAAAPLSSSITTRTTSARARTAK